MQDELKTERVDEPVADGPGGSAVADVTDTLPTVTGAEGAGAAAAVDLLAQLEAARATAEEHWALLLRSRAELENLRKRQERELENAHKFALDGFVRELLPVRDSLELGCSAAQEAGADMSKLREGTELTLKLLGDAMSRFGVEPVDPLDQPFNPALHQAISIQPRANAAPGSVVVVVQKGYMLNGRLVRPAMVIVSPP
jgi:molecular chaperone GrpE